MTPWKSRILHNRKKHVWKLDSFDCNLSLCSRLYVSIFVWQPKIIFASLAVGRTFQTNCHQKWVIYHLGKLKHHLQSPKWVQDILYSLEKCHDHHPFCKRNDDPVKVANKDWSKSGSTFPVIFQNSPFLVDFLGVFQSNDSGRHETSAQFWEHRISCWPVFSINLTWYVILERFQCEPGTGSIGFMQQKQYISRAWCLIRPKV